MTLLRCVLLLVAATTAACSPTLNWRDTIPDASGVRMLFPCKPTSRHRDVVLAGQPFAMHLHSCDAGDATFALTVVDIPDPASVPPTLDALKQAAIRNIDAISTSRSAFVAKGMAPTPAAQRLLSTGRLPNGSLVRQDAAFFINDGRIYQATILDRQDKRLSVEAADTFFEAIMALR